MQLLFGAFPLHLLVFGSYLHGDAMEQLLVLVRVQRHVVERELHGALVIDAKLGLHQLTHLLILLVLAPDFALLQQIFNLAISAQQCTALDILD